MWIRQNITHESGAESGAESGDNISTFDDGDGDFNLELVDPVRYREEWNRM